MYLKRYIRACESFGWNGGPSFQTRIKTLSNGRERRNADWAQEKNRYTVPFNNLSSEQYTDVRQMFQICRGMAHTFLYFDPLDRQATNEEFGIGDGVTLEFQLSKLSAADGVIYQREVYALYTPASDGTEVNATPVVTVNNVPTAVTVDYDRGLVIFAVAPVLGAVLRWSGFFSVWVRFDVDWLPFSIDNRRGGDYAHTGQVPLLEEPPPPEVTT